MEWLRSRCVVTLPPPKTLRPPTAARALHSVDAHNDDSVQAHPFFRPIDWQALEQGSIPRPYVPELSGDIDVRYFDKKYTSQPGRLSAEALPQQGPKHNSPLERGAGEHATRPRGAKGVVASTSPLTPSPSPLPASFPDYSPTSHPPCPAPPLNVAARNGETMESLPVRHCRFCNLAVPEERFVDSHLKGKRHLKLAGKHLPCCSSFLPPPSAPPPLRPRLLSVSAPLVPSSKTYASVATQPRQMVPQVANGPVPNATAVMAASTQAVGTREARETAGGALPMAAGGEMGSDAPLAARKEVKPLSGDGSRGDESQCQAGRESETQADALRSPADELEKLSMENFAFVAPVWRPTVVCDEVSR
ncbi:MAG: hypothetical protein SGPRY_005223 [Prymnesium sp.]